MQENCKVIFIAAHGRSGSTLLDVALGQIDGFFSGGELHLIWHYYLDPDWLCGCGSVLAACDVWSAVMKCAYGTHAGDECLRMRTIYRDWSRLRYSWTFWGLRSRDVATEFRARVAALYEGLRSVTGCRVIVDSSKSLAYGRLLQGIAGIEVYPVKLVRDPRAVSYSHQRKKAYKLAPGAQTRYLGVASAARSAASWSRVVLLNEIFWRHARGVPRIRYEDFIARPEATLAAIAKTVGEDATGVQVDSDHIRLQPCHTAGGNPSRFVTGDVVLRADQEWRDSMRLDQLMITSLTCAPLNYIMKYPLFSWRDSVSPTSRSEGPAKSNS